MKHDVIIPALNEAHTIAPILYTLANHPDIGKIVVCVDSATTDLTWDVADATGACDIVGFSHGKGQLVRLGLGQVKAERVLFCDADLTDLTLDHITQLTFNPHPGREHTEMIIGVPDFPDWDTINMEFRANIAWAWPWVSGERSMLTEVAKIPELHGYLMETQLNRANHDEGCDVRLERLHGLVSPFSMTPTRREDMEADRRWGRMHGVLSQ